MLPATKTLIWNAAEKRNRVVKASFFSFFEDVTLQKGMLYFGLKFNLKSEPVTWFTAYGNYKNHLYYACTMEPSRHLADFF